MWSADAYALMLCDLYDHADAYSDGIDIQQSAFAFLPLWSVGRCAPSYWPAHHGWLNRDGGRQA